MPLEFDVLRPIEFAKQQSIHQLYLTIGLHSYSTMQSSLIKESCVNVPLYCWTSSSTHLLPRRTFSDGILSYKHNLSTIQSYFFELYLAPSSLSNTSSFYDLYEFGKSLHIDNVVRSLNQIPLLQTPNHIKDRKSRMVIYHDAYVINFPVCIKTKPSPYCEASL